MRSVFLFLMAVGDVNLEFAFSRTCFLQEPTPSQMVFAVAADDDGTAYAGGTCELQRWRIVPWLRSMVSMSAVIATIVQRSYIRFHGYGTFALTARAVANGRAVETYSRGHYCGSDMIPMVRVGKRVASTGAWTAVSS